MQTLLEGTWEEVSRQGARLAGKRVRVMVLDETTEDTLLESIAQWLPEETWQRYSFLVKKRQAQTLTPDEQGELRTLTDDVETANARRLESLLELAQLRGTTLPAVMEQLGIGPRAHV